jgi:hypothetical protein
MLGLVASPLVAYVASPRIIPYYSSNPWLAAGIASLVAVVFAYLSSILSSLVTCGRAAWSAYEASLLYGPPLASLAILMVVYIPYLTSLVSSVFGSTDPVQAQLHTTMFFLGIHLLLLYFIVTFMSTDQACTLSSSEIAKEVSHLFKIYNRSPAPAAAADNPDTSRVVTD